MLHHERIGSGPRALLLAHGIYGAGSNWRGIARKLVAAVPTWSVVLVDLRLHGKSPPGEPPHTVAACAEDLRAVVDTEPDIVAVAGHSFGGKVALAHRAIAPARLLDTVVLDASPSARAPSGDSFAVLELMERLPETWARRDDFVDAIVAAGHTLTLAQWLAMNLVQRDGAYVSRLDLGAMRALLESYFATDLWATLLDPTLPGDVDVVIAERSGTLDVADRARLAQPPPHVHVRYIAADHWLHIDAPEAVVTHLSTRLSGL